MLHCRQSRRARLTRGTDAPAYRSPGGRALTVGAEREREGGYDIGRSTRPRPSTAFTLAQPLWGSRSTLAARPNDRAHAVKSGCRLVVGRHCC